MKISQDYNVDYEENRITIYDTRWYQIGEERYPSVTQILNAKAKPYALVQWLKQMGMNADIVSRQAMDEGSDVHNLCERYLKGEEIVYDDSIKFYEVWLPFQRFVKFCEEHKLIPILIEQTVFSRTNKFAGTLDLICILEIKGKKQLALIDLKRAKQSSLSYEYQVAAYKYAVLEMGVLNVVKDLVGELLDINPYLLLLNVDTKKGWRLKSVEDADKKYDCFLAVRKIWEDENPNFKMLEETYPTTVQSQFYKDRFKKIIGGYNNG